MPGDALERLLAAEAWGWRSLHACVNLLSWIEELPAEAAGALTFDDGVILVERRKVCWAVSEDMDRHFTELLCAAKDPPLEPSRVEDVYRRCKRDSMPVSGALLESGLVSEDELRRALCAHNGEAILRLSHTTAMPSRFRELAQRGYDERFAFTTAEMLAALGARGAGGLAAAASAELGAVLGGESSGLAFALDRDDGSPVLIAVANRCAVPVGQILQAGSWARGFLALGAGVDPDTALAAATFGPADTIVTWRAGEITCLAFCGTRAASALLLDKLARRLDRPSAAAEGAAS